MNHRWTLGAVLLLGCTWALCAQEKKAPDVAQPPPKKEAAAGEDPAHEELRAVKRAMTEAFNKSDIDALLKYVHADAIVTWQNGEVSKGPEGVRKYHERMLVGPNSVLKKVSADPEVTDLAVIFGSPPTTAIAYGKLKDHYNLRDGTDIAMNSLFSATLVKQDQGWKVVNFHGSTNIFDNAVLEVAVTKTMWWAGGIAGAVALLIGLFVGRLSGRRKA